MASREAYIARLMSKGKTKRERDLNRLKQSIQSSVKDLLSYQRSKSWNHCGEHGKGVRKEIHGSSE